MKLALIPNRKGTQITLLVSLRYSAFLIVRAFSSDGLLESNKLPDEEEKHSFKVFYLENSCGLSSKFALSASKLVHFETPKKPDSVLNIFRNHGFKETDIGRIVRSWPGVLTANPEKTLLPKLEFFQSIGFSTPDLAKIIATRHPPLRRSLKNVIIPCYDLLKSAVLTDEKVITTLKRSPSCMSTKNLAPNLALLRQLGVPQPFISLLLTNFPGSIFQEHSKFVEIVEKVKEMGFKHSEVYFVMGIEAIRRISKSKWESKLEVYKKWGCSNDAILLAFKIHPFCMISSERKIDKIMDLLVGKMNWPIEDILRYPRILSMSFEKRIAPRCSIIQVLLSEGLIHKLSVGTFLVPVEKLFVQRFVKRFQEKCPLLLSMYQVKVDLVNVGKKIQEDKTRDDEEVVVEDVFVFKSIFP